MRRRTTKRWAAALAAAAAAALAGSASASAGIILEGPVPPFVNFIVGGEEDGLAIQAGPIGDTVRIYGRNFIEVQRVTFGSADASFVDEGPYEIDAVAPPGEGTVPVTVITRDGTSKLAFGTGYAEGTYFTYVEPQAPPVPSPAPPSTVAPAASPTVPPQSAASDAAPPASTSATDGAPTTHASAKSRRHRAKPRRARRGRPRGRRRRSRGRCSRRHGRCRRAPRHARAQR
jgi:IPT/TIG domain